MFHSYFNEYAFDDININLLTSSCTPVSYTHLTLPTNREV